MKTKDALKIGMALGRMIGTLDAWEESKHPRADNGQFSSGGGGGSAKTKAESKTSNGAYSKLKGIHQEDIDEVLKTPVNSNVRGEVGHTLMPEDNIKAGKIRNAYRNGEISKEEARNQIAEMYIKYHDEYDN